MSVRTKQKSGFKLVYIRVVEAMNFPLILPDFLEWLIKSSYNGNIEIIFQMVDLLKATFVYKERQLVFALKEPLIFM